MTDNKESTSNMEATKAHDNYVMAPSEEHTHTVIFLHGRDSVASEFAAEFFESQASDDRTLPETFPSFKWIFPASGMRHSARFGVEISQWFDMWSTEAPDERVELQKEGIDQSLAMLKDIIAKEEHEVGFDHIILGGISQGCATAIFTMLFFETKFCGFVGLCGWLPLKRDIEEHIRQRKSGNEALQTPTFLSHSRDDDVVPLRSGENLYQGLKDIGISTIIWKVYEDGGHWVNEPQGIDDIVKFIQKAVTGSH